MYINIFKIHHKYIYNLNQTLMFRLFFILFNYIKIKTMKILVNFMII